MTKIEAIKQMKIIIEEYNASNKQQPLKCIFYSNDIGMNTDNWINLFIYCLEHNKEYILIEFIKVIEEIMNEDVVRNKLTPYLEKCSPKFKLLYGKYFI